MAPRPRPGCSHTPRGLFGYIRANEIPPLLRAVRTGFSHNQKRPNQHEKFQRSAGSWKKERLCSDFLPFFVTSRHAGGASPSPGIDHPAAHSALAHGLSCWPVAPADLLSSSREGLCPVHYGSLIPCTQHTVCAYLLSVEWIDGQKAGG